MELLLISGVIVLSYLIGSLPSGLIIVKLSTGKDIRAIESGRTGGTNAARAAGLWAGLSTAILDCLKATATVWLARVVLPEFPLGHVFAPLAAILGHNYSVFLLERNGQGKLRLRGGAGGAPTVGGALGLWAPSVLIIIPMAAAIFYFIGYASVTTMSVALLSIIIFAYRAWVGLSPWEYVLYGILAEILLIWALLPNIRRLLKGTERLSGFRARYKKKDMNNPSTFRG
jgi:acyl phosphate:glycerol-3-phosphate acyltransferase